MGGEKLNRSRLITFAVFLVIFLYGNIVPIFSQSEPAAQRESAARSESASQAVDESTIILGETPAAAVAANGSSVFVMVRMVLVLALAALAIYGVVFFIKRLARPQEVRDPHLKILARVPLSNDSFAAVISLGPKAWLIGGASGAVNLISEIEDTETLETMLIDDARKNAGTGKKFPDFRALLRKFGSAGSESADSSESASSIDQIGAGSFTANLRKQRDRLKGL